MRLLILHPRATKKSLISIEVRCFLSLYSSGVAIKKFKLSNTSAIFILLAADLGIGYFTLPYVFHIDNICGKFLLF